MTLYGGKREIGNFGIGDVLFIFDMVNERAQSCAKNDGGFRHICHFRTYVLGCLVDFFYHKSEFWYYSE